MLLDGLMFKVTDIWHHSVKYFSNKCNKVNGCILIWWMWFNPGQRSGPVVFLWMLLAVLMSTDWRLSVKCVSMSEFTNMFYKQRSTHIQHWHGGVNYKLVRKISISKFVFFISSSYIQVEKRSFFLLQVESIVNIGLFLNFLFSLKSITGFFRRSEARRW